MTVYAAMQSDLKIYNDQYQAGAFETLSQMFEQVISGSNGAIVMDARDIKGNYEQIAFFNAISGVVSARDITSDAAATKLKPTQSENVGVKVARKFGPVEIAADALRAAGIGQPTYSFMLGQYVAREKFKNYLNTAIAAAVAAISGVTGNNYDLAGSSETTKTLTTGALATGLSKFGDRAQDIVCFLMYSKPYWNLIGEQLTAKYPAEAAIGSLINSGVPATLGRPCIVTDAPGLTDANGSATDTYNTLGLTPGAIRISESTMEQIITEIVTGQENLIVRMQGESDFVLSLRGFAWDIANGGAAPTDAELATTAYWDKVASSDKLTAGIRIKTQ